MASIIRIKRSGVTGSPATLAQGEFAYSFLDGTLTNGGDRLYLGTGTETNGAAANVEAIGGKYFTAKLDHTPGIVTANSAIIVDDNRSIDTLFFGNNLQITGNTISTSTGDITIDPAGDLNVLGDVNITGSLSLTGDVGLTGNTSVDNLFVTSLTPDRVVFVGANDQLVDSANLTFNGSVFTLLGELNADNLRLDGNTLSSTNTNGDIFIDPNGSGATRIVSNITRVGNANVGATITTNGTGNLSLSTNDGINSGFIRINQGANGNIVLDPNGTGSVDVSSSIITGVSDPVGGTDAVNRQFLDAAEYTVAADTGTSSPILITSGTFTVAGGTALTSVVSGAAGSATVTINLDNTTVTAGAYGSATKIPTFTVDAQGRLTAAGEEDVATTLSFDADTGSGAVDLLTDVLNIVGGTGVDTVASGNTVTISIGQDVYTDSNVQFADGNFTGNLIVGGDLTVNGNTTIVATSTLEVEDALIKLARGNTADSIDIGFYGQYGAGTLKSGLFRSHTNGEYYLFKDLDADITTTNIVDLNGLQLADANFADINVANAAVSGNVDVIGTVSADLFVGEIDGGTY
jgi:trimeric autotransporter adhesin